MYILIYYVSRCNNAFMAFPVRVLCPLRAVATGISTYRLLQVSHMSPIYIQGDSIHGGLISSERVGGPNEASVS